MLQLFSYFRDYGSVLFWVGSSMFHGGDVKPRPNQS